MIKLYKFVFVFIITLIVVNFSFSQGKDLPVNLSLVYPVSINQSKLDNVNFNVGIIGSQFNNLKGLGINGLYSVLGNDLNGLQINGLYAETRNKLKGIQLTGGANVVTKGGTGAMIGGLANMTFDDFTGFQLSTIANFGFENVKGVQASVLYNLVGKNINLLQVAVAGNVAGKMMSGAQLSLLFNLAGNTNSGIQVASINLTKFQRGAQFGLVNIAEDNDGFQLGIFNIVDKKQKGLSLGLFYMGEKSKVQMLMSGGNISYGNLGFRFKTNNVYTMLTLGGPVAISITNKSVMTEYRVGYSFDLKLLDVNTDVGFMHISNEKDQTPGKPSSNQFGLSFRAGLEKNIFKKFGLFVNAGILRAADSYNDSVFKNHFLFEGGIVVL
ncbi:MAG: hypothetical protein ACOYN6_07850 [Ignavibacteria bacterium]